MSERSRSKASGDWYSLMSIRTSRSADPKRNSARVLAISVLPVPVGPTKRNTPSGRVGSVTPALIIAMRSTMQSTASGCSSTRSVKKERTSSSGSGAAASSSASGKPGARCQRGQHVPAVEARPVRLGRLGRGRVDESENISRLRDAREELLGELECLGERLVVGRSTSSASCASACRVTAIVSGSSRGRMRTSSNALFTRGLADTRSSAAAGVTSATRAISPDSMCGRSASSSPCGLRECWPANSVSWSSGTIQTTPLAGDRVDESLDAPFELAHVDGPGVESVQQSSRRPPRRRRPARARRVSARSSPRRARRRGARSAEGSVRGRPPRSRRALAGVRRAVSAARRTAAPRCARRSAGCGGRATSRSPRGKQDRALPRSDR